MLLHAEPGHAKLITSSQNPSLLASIRLSNESLLTSVLHISVMKVIYTTSSRNFLTLAWIPLLMLGTTVSVKCFLLVHDTLPLSKVCTKCWNPVSSITENDWLSRTSSHQFFCGCIRLKDHLHVYPILWLNLWFFSDSWHQPSCFPQVLASSAADFLSTNFPYSAPCSFRWLTKLVALYCMASQHSLFKICGSYSVWRLWIWYPEQ